MEIQDPKILFKRTADDRIVPSGTYTIYSESEPTEAEIYSYHPSEILFKPPQLPIPFWESGEVVPRVNGTVYLGLGALDIYNLYGPKNIDFLRSAFIPGLKDFTYDR